MESSSYIHSFIQQTLIDAYFVLNTVPDTGDKHFWIKVMLDARLIFLSVIFFWSLFPPMSSNMIHNIVLRISYSSFQKCQFFVLLYFKE